MTVSDQKSSHRSDRRTDDHQDRLAARGPDPAPPLLVLTSNPDSLAGLVAESGYPGTVTVVSVAEVQASGIAELCSSATSVCILADIRESQRLVLEQLSQVAVSVPVIALTDNTTAFLPDYPFGCSVVDIANIDELGASTTTLLERRVTHSLQLLKNPLAITDTADPRTRALQQIVDSSSDWIIVKDLDHRFVVVPEEFCQLAGLSVQEVVGKDDLQIGTSAKDVFGDPDNGRAGFWKQDDEVTESGEVSMEDAPEWHVFSGGVRHKRTYRVPLFNASGEVYALLVCVQDMTEQKHNEHLLAERTRMLADMSLAKQASEKHQERAEEAVTAKNRFLAAASHDLRQPLHAMGLYLDVLEARLESEEALQIMEKLKESNAALYTMFSSLLDISRLDAGVVEPEMEHLNMVDYCSVLRHEFVQMAAEKNLEFRSDVNDVFVYTDKTMCSRVIRNLVKNAIENTSTGSVTLRVTQENTHAVIEVEDTGCGMEQELLDNIFNEYYSSNQGTQTGRIGLGLAIVDRMCKLLGMTVNVKSTPGKGSLFHLVTPVGNPSLAKSARKFKQQGPLSNVRVLVLDDESTILEGTKSILSLHGCTADTAASTDGAFELLAESSGLPEVIVADYELGHGETGLAAIQKIREETGQAIPAVLVTGDTSQERQNEARSHAIRLLHKPLQPTELVHAIREARERTTR